MGDHTVAKFASIRPLVSNSVNTYMQHKHKEQMHYNDNIKQYSSGYSSNKENYKCSRTRSARLKKLKISDFGEIEDDGLPRMQTMDRRVSSSSDQIDRLRKQGISRKPVRTNSSSQISYENITREGKENIKSDFVTGKVHRKSDLLNSSFSKYRPRQIYDVNKSPLALFLEDDGPYSRKLFGSLAQRERNGQVRYLHKKHLICITFFRKSL